MKQIATLASFATASMIAATVLLGLPGLSLANTVTTNFETPTFILGSINGQSGWGGDGIPVNPTYDQAVVPSSSSTIPYDYSATFGSQSFRLSDAVTSGSFGDWVFAKPLTNAVGEVDSTNSTFSPGTLQRHFETEFDIASTLPGQRQTGLHVSVSPDRGDGSRMSYLRFEDGANGIDVFFDDVQGTSNPANFVETQVASGLDRTKPHHIKLTIDLVDGPSNDVVKVYVDGTLVHTGTSWENYYRYDTEASSEQSPRIIKTLLFQARGTATPADLGHGFLFDNVSLLSGPTPPTSVQVHIFKYLDGAQATPVSANNVSFPMLTTYNDPVVGSGTNVPFTLNPSGWTTGDIPYEASTGARTPGSSASFSEDTSTALVGTSCTDAGTNPYALVGYSVGTTLGGATSSSPTLTPPNFANLSSDEYVVVWNKSCTVIPQTTLKVHILKYLNGAPATAASANAYLFPMTATWSAANIGAGSGTYPLGNNFGGASNLYGADTAAMSAPADYSTSEITNNIDSTSKVLPIGATCVAGDYRLDGYQTSAVSFADAATQSVSTTPPSYSQVATDQYVIVDNETCPTTGSLTVEKNAIGGNGTFSFVGSSTLGSFQITTSGTSAGGTGSTTFAGLAPGTYHVIEATSSGWTLTDNECANVLVAAGAAPVCIITNTKNARLGEIRGTKFVDIDGDGTLKDGDHHRLPGVTIYLDTNNSSTLDSGEPSTVTDSHGNYDFTGLPAGTYYVREVVPSGWMQTVPSSGSYTVVLGAGKIAKNKNFGDFKFGTTSGMKFNDLNGNGRKDPGDVGLPGWTIILKGPHNFSTSTVTDSSGNYSFGNLGPGLYTLSEVMQSGWTQTTHPWPVWIRSGTNAKGENFGNTQHPKHWSASFFWPGHDKDH